MAASGAACGVVALVGGRIVQAPEDQPAKDDPAPARCKPAYDDRPVRPLSVDLAVRDADGCFKPRVATLDTGTTKTLVVRYQNHSDGVHEDVVVRVGLPPGVVLVPNSTDVNSGHTDGWQRAQSNNLTEGGIVIGDFGRGGSAYVRFDVTVPFETDLACGLTKLRTVGVARPKGLHEHFNSTDIAVVRPC